MSLKVKFNADKEYDQLFHILKKEPYHPSEILKHLTEIRSFIIDIKKESFEEGFLEGIKSNQNNFNEF